MKINLTIKGKQINLRKLKKSDAQSLFENANNFAIAKYTILPYPYTIKDALSFIQITQRQIKRKESFEIGIEYKQSGQIIGMVGLVKVDFENKNAEIGYWLGKKYWGRKIMKEAVQLILKFGFQTLGLERIYARVMHPNVASAKLLEKSGFKYEGRCRKTVLTGKNWMDDLIYSILKEEFNIIKNKYR